MLKHAFLCTAFATALAVPLAAEQTGTPPALQMPAQQLTETQIIDYSLVFPGGDAIGEGTVIHASAQRADGSQRPDQHRGYLRLHRTPLVMSGNARLRQHPSRSARSP